MQKELGPNSYRLTFEKVAITILAAMSLWFCFSGLFGNIFVDLNAFLKLGNCFLSAIVGYRILAKGILGPACAHGLAALIYNPFVELTLDRNIWHAVHFFIAAACLWSGWQIRKISKIMTPERIKRMRIAEARAYAINEAIADGSLDVNLINSYLSKLRGEDSGMKIASAENSSAGQKSATSLKEETIHFVLKGPAPGVPITKGNALITAKVANTIDEDGERLTVIKIYSGADLMTLHEARSASYWRERIEEGKLTDAQVIDWLHSVELHTPQNYIRASSKDRHPGEVRITNGLTLISLHYAIAYFDNLGFPASTVEWMKAERAKGFGSERVIDIKNAENLKRVLETSGISSEFVSHLRKSVSQEPAEE